MKKYLFVITILIFLGMSAVSFGQSFNTEPGVTITANPSDPQPGESVSVTLTSYEVNLDLSYIKWTSGSESKEGYGEKTWTIKMGTDTTKTTTVSAEISLTNGTKILKDVTLTPAQVDLAWEAKDVKIPPFYLGKKIPVRENNIRVAVLNQSNTKSKQTAYYWSRNDKSLQNGSGTGKNFIDFKNTELEKSETVDVSLMDQNNQMERSIKIPMVNPKVLFYEYNPITGLALNKTVKDSALGYDGTISIFTVPLGLNINNRNEISWKLSNQEVNNQNNPYLLSFSTPDKKGVVPVDITIDNLGAIYQEFVGQVRLNF